MQLFKGIYYKAILYRNYCRPCSLKKRSECIHDVGPPWTLNKDRKVRKLNWECLFCDSYYVHRQFYLIFTQGNYVLSWLYRWGNLGIVRGTPSLSRYRNEERWSLNWKFDSCDLKNRAHFSLYLPASQEGSKWFVRFMSPPHIPFPLYGEEVQWISGVLGIHDVFTVKENRPPCTLFFLMRQCCKAYCSKYVLA